MKLGNLFFFVIFSSVSFSGLSQDCDKLLEDGMYLMIHTISRTSLNQDMRSYLLSEQFRSDLKEGDWGTTFSIPIDGVPISIGLNSSDKEFNEFRQRIEKSTQFSLSTTDYKELTKTLPNPELYNAFVECSGNNIVGLVKGRKIENDETVIFNFYYRPASTSGKAPKVTSFVVEPKSALIDAGGIKAGERIPSYLMSIVCRRSQVNEITVNIQTEAGPISDNSGPTRSSRFETPIGTIIASFLPFNSFREANGEKGVWKKTDKWAPCDGRDVSGSEFAKYSQSNTPDLRGYFLRGLNEMDPNPPAGVETVNRDVQRIVGTNQDDAFQGHRHNIPGTSNVGGRYGFWTGSNADPRYLDPHSESIISDGHGDPRVANETRPKNIAVYYYIKIN